MSKKESKYFTFRILNLFRISCFGFRIFHLCILLLSLCSLCLVAFQEKWSTLEGVHYDIQYTSSTAQAKELLNFMDEYIFPNYKFMLNLPDWESEKKFTIRLYSNQDEYLKDTGAPKMSGAHYNPQTKELVGFSDNADKMQALFAHEGMHQFTDMAIPDFGRRMPMWYIEGMADCIGNCKVDDGKFYVCVKDGWMAKQRLPKLVDMFKKNEYIKLKNLLYYNKDMFYKESEIDMTYAEAWGFCHFLLNAPYKGMDTDRKIKGKYKSIIVDLHNLLANYKDIGLEDAYKKAFVYEGKPLDTTQLEKEFKEYILTLAGK